MPCFVIAGMVSLLVLLTGACSPQAASPTPAPTSAPAPFPSFPSESIPDGWTLFAKPAARFALAMSPDWKQAPFETADFAFTPLVDTAFTVHLYAVEEQPGDGGSFPSTLAVITLDLPDADSFDSLLQKNIEMADALAMPGSAAIIGEVQMYNTTAVQLTAFTTSIDIGGFVPRSVRTVLIDAGDTAYLLSVTSLASRSGDFQRDLDAMIRSFRLLPMP